MPEPAVAAPLAPARTTSASDGDGSGRSGRSSVPGLVWWVICLCLAVPFLYPLYVMLSMALKSPAGQGRIPPTFLPHHPTLANFAHLASVQGLNVFGNLGNSVVVTLAATV